MEIRVISNYGFGAPGKFSPKYVPGAIGTLRSYLQVFWGILGGSVLAIRSIDRAKPVKSLGI